MIEGSKNKFNYEDDYHSGTTNKFQQRFDTAVKLLSEDFIPEEILCRSKEIAEITKFLKDFMSTGIAKESLYISGSPGIGKTLSVNTAFNKFFESRDKTKYDKNVKRIFINAMNLKYPADIYKNIYYQLFGTESKKKISPEQALHSLDGIFRENSTNKEDAHLFYIKKVLFIDEIDYLKTGSEEILYNLFDWTQSDKSRLAIIAISNTFDFPERLKPKIISRIGNKRLSFHPYKSEELEKILNQRVESTQVFADAAIEYISKKIAKVSSDARKCFEILREAIIMHLNPKTIKNFNESNFRVPINTLTKAYDNVYANPFNLVFKQMPTDYKRVLLTISEHYQRDTKLLSVSAIANYFENSSKRIGRDEINMILLRLMDIHTIEMKHTVNSSNSASKCMKNWNVKLLLDFENINYAHLQDHDDLSH